MAKIELFKSTKFPLTTDEGEVEENCIKLLSASSPLVVAQWKACTRAIIGEFGDTIRDDNGICYLSKVT